MKMIGGHCETERHRSHAAVEGELKGIPFKIGFAALLLCVMRKVLTACMML